MKRKDVFFVFWLPEELVKALEKIEEAEQADRSATVRKLLRRAISEWKKEYAAKLYGEGKVTLERAAMEADVSVREMMDYMRTKRVPGQYELRDLEEDMARFYERLAGPKPTR